MKLKCPACGASASLDILLSHDGAREAVMLALRLPAPMGKKLVQYLALFRPVKRDLSFDRLARLLEELLPDIERAQVDHDGHTWPAPQTYWQQAIDTVLAARDAGRLTLPLKSHGYLYSVLAGLASSAEGRAEQQQEQRRQRGDGWRYGSGLTPVTSALPRDSPGPDKPPKTPMPGHIKNIINKGNPA